MREVLFPYAQEHLAAFIAGHRDDANVVAQLRETAREAGEPAASEERVVAILRAWMDDDRKATPLKTLQGLIWADGYARGVLRGHVYADAAAGLRRWCARGIELYVYSSGSIAAQKLLFGCSTAGDLRPLFSDYFDTTSGAKTDADSYRHIATAIGRSPQDVLFLSDREAELDAASAAGWQVAHLVRPADTPAGTTSRYAVFATFDEIDVEPAS